MSALKSIATGILLVATALCWATGVYAGPSVWPNQKGEICVYNDTTLETARIAVMKTVGNNYIVQGVSEEQDDTTLFDGNAVAYGNVVLMHISGSGYVDSNDEVHTMVGTIRLDLADGTGWAKVIGFHCQDQSSGFEDDCEFSNDGQQDLTIIECD